jgi:hypothetical protein
MVKMATAHRKRAFPLPHLALEVHGQQQNEMKSNYQPFK